MLSGTGGKGDLLAEVLDGINVCWVAYVGGANVLA